MNNKILITGGAGYIGSHMVRFLMNRGIDADSLVIVDNLVNGSKKLIHNDVNFYKIDMRNKDDLDKVFEENKISDVFHFAGFAYVGESMKNPTKYFENNILSSLNLLESMREHGCKSIIFSSSCSTYGIPEKLPITENEKQEPINPYGESKLFIEKMLKWYDKIYEIKHINLRYFNVAGADFGIGEIHDPETHLIPLVILTALGRQENVKILGTDFDTDDGTCIRDYIHVTDLCDAHYKAFEYLNKNQESDSFNLGTAKGTSVKEIIGHVEKISKKKINAIESSRRSGDPAVLVADFSKARKVLGWKPTEDIQEIISSAWKWHNKHL